LLRTEPRVLGRPQVFPRDVEVWIVWITSEVHARAHETFAVDVDPRSPGRVLCLPEDVSTVVDAVEVDRLAVVVRPRAVRRRGEPDHFGQSRTAVDVRHYFVVLRASRDVSGPPHQAWHAPTTFKRRAFFASEGRGASVGVGVLPGTVVSRHDNDRVGCLRADGIHDSAYVVIEFH